LIVLDGLKDIDASVQIIKVACKFVKSSPNLLATLKKGVDYVGVCSKAMVTLDVVTR